MRFICTIIPGCHRRNAELQPYYVNSSKCYQKYHVAISLSSLVLFFNNLFCFNNLFFIFALIVFLKLIFPEAFPVIIEIFTRLV